MTMTTSGSPILRADQVAALLLDPVEAESVATQVATVVRTESHSYRIPKVVSDPTAAFVEEGQEIPVSDGELDEIVITPAKVAGLTVISSELANDSSPEAAATVGNGLARDIARKIDLAFFGNLASPAPKGLGSLAVNATPEDVQGVDAGASWTNLDWAEEARSLAEGVGASLTSFVANPVDALALSLLKSGTGSNVPLLGSDPTQPTRRLIGGTPLLTSPAVPAGTVWAIPEGLVTVVVRQDAEIATDSSVFFTSDRVAVRATARISWGFPQKSALVKITKTA